MSKTKPVLFGLYKDEEPVLKAIKTIRDKGYTVNDVISPFPIHGLDPVLGIHESRLHMAGFVYGLTGFLFALSAMTWITVSNWPNVFGGKPFFSLPSMVPIMFEFTVLSASVGMVLTFYIVNQFAPGVTPVILDPRLTDDTFALVFDENQLDENGIADVKSMMTASGAFEIHKKEVPANYKFSR
jgi:hypothetical protein